MNYLRKKRIRIVSFILVVAIIFNLLAPISNASVVGTVDNPMPTISITASPTDYTYNPVTLTANVTLTSNESTVTYVGYTKDPLPDNVLQMSDEERKEYVQNLPESSFIKLGETAGTYTAEVSKNGIYYFKAVANSSLSEYISTSGYVVQNIKEPEPEPTIDPPVVTYELKYDSYKDGWTNTNINLNISVETTDRIASLLVNDSLVSVTKDGNIYKATYVVESNDTYHIVASDSKGNIGEKSVAINNIDKEPPTNNEPKAQATEQYRILIRTSQTDKLSGIDSDTLMYRMTDSNGTTGTWGTNNDFKELESGTTYFFQTKVKDKAGNETVSKVFRTSTIQITQFDSVPPEIKHTITPDGWTNDMVTVKLNVTDNFAVKEVKVNDNVIEGSNGSYEFTATDNGDYKIVAKDTFDNESTLNLRISSIDRTKPTTYEPSVYQKTESSITVKNEQKDLESGISKVRYRMVKSVYGEASLSGFDWQERSDTYVRFEGLTPDTTYYIQTESTDKAGNVSTSSVATVKTNAASTPVVADQNIAPTDKKPQVYQSARDVYVYCQQIDKDGKIAKVEYRECDPNGYGKTGWQTHNVFSGPKQGEIHFYQTRATDDKGATTISKIAEVYVQARTDTQYIDITLTNGSGEWIEIPGQPEEEEPEEDNPIKTRPLLYADMSTWTLGPVEVIAEGDEWYIQTKVNDGEWEDVANRQATNYGDQVYARYTDGNGHYGDVVQITISNIDKDPPSKDGPEPMLLNRSETKVLLNFMQTDDKSGVDETTIMYRLCDEYGRESLPGYDWTSNDTMADLEMYKTYYAQTYCKDKLGNESYSDVIKFRIIHFGDDEVEGMSNMWTNYEDPSKPSQSVGKVDSDETIPSERELKEAEENAKAKQNDTVVNNYFIYGGGSYGTSQYEMFYEWMNQLNKGNGDSSVTIDSYTNRINDTGSIDSIGNGDQEEINDGAKYNNGFGALFVETDEVQGTPSDLLAQNEVGVIKNYSKENTQQSNQSTNQKSTNQQDVTITSNEIPAAGASMAVLFGLLGLNVVGLYTWKKLKKFDE